MTTKTSKNGRHTAAGKNRVRRQAARPETPPGPPSHGSLEARLLDPETQLSEWRRTPPKYSVDVDALNRPLKLNLGAGVTNFPGYLNVDDKLGTKVFPLAHIDDESVEEIRASHILEHFGHQQVQQVLSHWVSKLKPGGRIRIAVPDFEKIARLYLDGQPINPQGYVMGGQIDQYDVHGTLFDRELLSEVMVVAGLERIQQWKSDAQDCAALPISLNLEGYKPLTSDLLPHGVTAFLSAPRFGPIMHYKVAVEAFGKLKIPYNIGQGSMWHHVLCEQMEAHIALPGVEYLITCDYDTVFEASDVVGLWRLMRAYPEIDALVPVQSKRSCHSALFSILDEHGNHVRQIPMNEFRGPITEIFSGHFGLTMFRASALRETPRPWMIGVPHKQTGRWQDDEYPTGKIDPDIHFWHQFRAAGKRVFLANRIPVGHLEEVITWPSGHDFTPIHQSTREYNESGKPAEVAIP